ncbi:M1 family aminopeptidase [Yinghuangia aomiensis]
MVREAGGRQGFWKLKTADPGRDEIFSYSAIYLRGGMTLQALRVTMGDRDFFTLLRTWVDTYKYRNADTGDLRALAEKISHKNLKPLFDAWLYSEEKLARPWRPAGGAPPGSPARSGRRHRDVGAASAHRNVTLRRAHP